MLKLDLTDALSAASAAGSAKDGASKRRGTPVPSRRAFLTGAAAGAVLLAFRLDLKGARAAEASDALSKDPAQPNAFVRIAADDTVTVMIKHLDMGQGNTTGLATILADELDADWSQMRVAFAPADAKLYANLLMGPVQGTGGSTAIANSWFQLRKAGAAARAMLVAAAAEKWGVPAGEITVAKGVISHKSGKQARFGEFAEAAAAKPVPQEPRLKTPAEWTLIGGRVPRIDSVAKTDGTAIYSLDIRRPGQVTALVAHPPRFGATVKSVDAEAAQGLPGVVGIVTIPTGVAVIARDTWSAMKARDALKITWDESAAETRSSDAILAEYRETAKTSGLVASQAGDADAGIKGAAKVLEAEFSFPYLAHAAMEPLNATIERAADGSYDVYAGCQIQTIEQAVVAATLGVTTDKVRLHTQWAGGSFGRRATPGADYFAEAAAIVKAWDGKAPVHLVWTREDDMAGGYYRPQVYHTVKAGLDAKGQITGWRHAMVGKSIMIGSPFEATLVKNGIDSTTVEGASDTPYDELAHAAGADPVAYRLSLLTRAPRLSGVLRLAAEKSGWSQKPSEKGRGLGVAVHESFGSYVAMVADVTAADSGVRVNRIVAAVDVGVAVNPDVVRAQVEGAVGFALSAVLRNRITLKDGVVQERNFDSYQPTRISEMPRVEVHIVPSEVAPTGIGEPGVPVLAPAIANAVFAATGQRVRSLPLDLSGLRGA